MNLSKIGHGGGSTDGCQAAFVPVVEVLARLATQFVSDIVGGGFALLHRDWCDPRQPLAALVLQNSQVPDHEDFGVSGNAVVGIHQHAPFVAIDIVPSRLEMAKELGAKMMSCPNV